MVEQILVAARDRLDSGFPGEGAKVAVVEVAEEPSVHDALGASLDAAYTGSVGEASGVTALPSPASR